MTAAVAWAVAVYAVVLLVLRVRTTGRFAADDRAVVVRAAVDAVVVLALVRAVAPPPGVGAWAWVLAAGAVGGAVAGAVSRWPRLRAGRGVSTAGYAVVGALVVAVVA